MHKKSGGAHSSEVPCRSFLPLISIWLLETAVAATIGSSSSRPGNIVEYALVARIASGI